MILKLSNALNMRLRPEQPLIQVMISLLDLFEGRELKKIDFREILTFSYHYVGGKIEP